MSQFDWQNAVDKSNYNNVGDMILELYNKHKSQRIVSEIIGVSTITLRKKMRELNIKTNSKGGPNFIFKKNSGVFKVFRNRHRIKDLDSQAACELCGVDRSYFYKICNKYNLKYNKQERR